MEKTNNSKRAAAIAYLNKCFEMRVTWIDARDWAVIKFHCTVKAVECWRKLSKYNEEN